MNAFSRLTSTHIVYLVVLLTVVVGTVLVGATGRSEGAGARFFFELPLAT